MNYLWGVSGEIDVTIYKRGVINVAEIMKEYHDRQERLADWRARTARAAEWDALKQVWRVEEQVFDAQGPEELVKALQARTSVYERYGEGLQRALRKWEAVRQARREGRQYELPYDPPLNGTSQSRA